MIDNLIQSLINSSKINSIAGQTENAQHQESTLQALGFAKIDGQRVEKVTAEDLAVIDVDKKLESQHLVLAFQGHDVIIASEENGNKAVLMFYVHSSEMADGVPVFWKNYLAEELFPVVFMICIERIQINADTCEFMALPYFAIFDLSEKEINPLLAFVGAQLREKAVKNVNESKAEAMSNIGIFLPLCIAALNKRQLAEV